MAVEGSSQAGGTCTGPALAKSRISVGIEQLDRYGRVDGDPAGLVYGESLTARTGASLGVREWSMRLYARGDSIGGTPTPKISSQRASVIAASGNSMFSSSANAKAACTSL